eukprot:gb/GEZN01020306.1/.p1 GENE.gb/GEZN01020306.1/~~gb/GEZN01020306.1/.p1  ORF type:complete len:197 (-),score=52.38 gb/GEZN01020306.1/:42-632(-)
MAGAGETKAETMSAGEELDFSDPAVAAAWKDTKDFKKKTNWCLFGMADGGKSDQKVEVVGVGEGGLNELKTKLNSLQSRILFGSLIVVGVDKQKKLTSNREKFVCFTFVGNSVPEQARAKFNFQKMHCRNFFGSVHCTMDVYGNNLGALSQRSLAEKLLAAGAAHKPTHYNFGPGQEYAIAKAEDDDAEDSEGDFD